MSSFVPVSRIDRFKPGSRTVIDLGHREILIINESGLLHAISNICTCPAFVVGHRRPGDEEDPLTHGGRLARLEPGWVESGTIRCPAHQSVYDLASGKPLRGMAEISLGSFETRIVGDVLMVATRTAHERRSDPGD